MRQRRLFVPTPVAEPTTVAVSNDAHALTCSFWERTNPKPVVKFIALQKMVQRFLDAGWPPQAVSQALDETMAYTVGAITYSLNQQRNGRRNGHRPSTVERSWRNIMDGPTEGIR